MFLNILHILTNKVEDLITKYRAMMYSLAFSIARNADLAEDIVQEASIRLTKNATAIDNVNSDQTRNYVYTVVKNEALRIAAKEKKTNYI